MQDLTKSFKGYADELLGELDFQLSKLSEADFTYAEKVLIEVANIAVELQKTPQGFITDAIVDDLILKYQDAKFRCSYAKYEGQICKDNASRY